MEKFQPLLDKVKNAIGSIFGGNKDKFEPPLFMQREQTYYDEDDLNDFERESNKSILNSPWIWAAGGLIVALGLGVGVGFLTRKKTKAIEDSSAIQTRTVENNNNNDIQMVETQNPPPNNQNDVIMQSLATIVNMVQNLSNNQQIQQIRQVVQNLPINNNAMNQIPQNTNQQIQQLPPNNAMNTVQHVQLLPVQVHNPLPNNNNVNSGARYSTDNEIFTGRNIPL